MQAREPVGSKVRSALDLGFKHKLDNRIVFKGEIVQDTSYTSRNVECRRGIPRNDEVLGYWMKGD